MQEKAVDRPISAPGALIWTALLLVVERFCVGIVEAARGRPLADIVSFATCEVLAISLVAFALVRTHAPEAPLRRALGARPVAIHHVLLSAAAGLGLYPILSALDDRILARFPYDDPETMARVEKLIASAPRAALILGLFVVIPVAHEVFFRGLLFGGLRAAAGVAFTIVVTALLFAVAPLDLRALPSALLLGVAVGWLRAQSGSVFAPIVAMLAFRALDTVAILQGHDPSADTTYPVKWIAGGAVIALVALASMRAPKAPTG